MVINIFGMFTRGGVYSNQNTILCLSWSKPTSLDLSQSTNKQHHLVMFGFYVQKNKSFSQPTPNLLLTMCLLQTSFVNLKLLLFFFFHNSRKRNIMKEKKNRHYWADISVFRYRRSTCVCIHNRVNLILSFYFLLIISFFLWFCTQNFNPFLQQWRYMWPYRETKTSSSETEMQRKCAKECSVLVSYRTNRL